MSIESTRTAIQINRIVCNRPINIDVQTIFSEQVCQLYHGCAGVDVGSAAESIVVLVQHNIQIAARFENPPEQQVRDYPVIEFIPLHICLDKEVGRNLVDQTLAQKTRFEL